MKYLRKGLNDMMNEKDAWNQFCRSGSVMDYLQYTSVRRAQADSEPKEGSHEVQDQGTDRQTTEYR